MQARDVRDRDLLELLPERQHQEEHVVRGGMSEAAPSCLGEAEGLPVLAGEGDARQRSGNGGCKVLRRPRQGLGALHRMLPVHQPRSQFQQAEEERHQRVHEGELLLFTNVSVVIYYFSSGSGYPRGEHQESLRRVCVFSISHSLRAPTRAAAAANDDTIL